MKLLLLPLFAALLLPISVNAEGNEVSAESISRAKRVCLDGHIKRMEKQGFKMNPRRIKDMKDICNCSVNEYLKGATPNQVLKTCMAKLEKEMKKRGIWTEEHEENMNIEEFSKTEAGIEGHIKSLRTCISESRKIPEYPYIAGQEFTYCGCMQDAVRANKNLDQMVSSCFNLINK